MGNEFGQLGDSTTSNHWYAQTTINLLYSRYALSIALGGDHTCAVLDDNTLKCWGLNNVGQLGVFDIANRNSPSSVDSLGGDRYGSSIALGGYHTCAILDNESL